MTGSAAEMSISGGPGSKASLSSHPHHLSSSASRSHRPSACGNTAANAAADRRVCRARREIHVPGDICQLPRAAIRWQRVEHQHRTQHRPQTSARRSRHCSPCHARSALRCPVSPQTGPVKPLSQPAHSRMNGRTRLEVQWVVRILSRTVRLYLPTLDLLDQVPDSCRPTARILELDSMAIGGAARKGAGHGSTQRPAGRPWAGDPPDQTRSRPQPRAGRQRCRPAPHLGQPYRGWQQPSLGHRQAHRLRAWRRDLGACESGRADRAGEAVGAVTLRP